MTSANVELVRSIFAEWERGDFSASNWADHEIEFVIADGPTPGRWHGLDGLVEGFRGLVNAWEEYRVQAVDYLEVDQDRVLVPLRPAGRGRTSGLELERTGSVSANLFELKRGRVIRLALYFDRDRAVTDLSLEA